jgi:hypothetical protein
MSTTLSSHPLIYEINTWPWLAELGSVTGTPVDLSTVPDAEWDDIAGAGFDAVWLMGVWERSPAGVAIALADDVLVASFRAALPDWTPADVVGSPYSIRAYVVDEALGGRQGLAVARAALAARGVGLILDFVPNHVAPDHPWTASHPEYFVIDGAAPALGRDPYSPPWPDVVQLNAFNSRLRAAMAETLADIADQCDGVRCDMAMLVMNDVFARTWGDRVGAAPGSEYWPWMIGAVRERYPQFCFLAEAYWDTEYALQQQGFDYCYDKRLYDRLLGGDAEGVRAHLSAAVSFQDRLLRFAENHDEARLATVDPARQRAIGVATLTQTGARLIHHGQLTGRRAHLPVFLGRFPREDVDDEVAGFYREVLEVLRDSTFRSGIWALCEAPLPMVAWCWAGDRRWVVVVNLGDTAASGRVLGPWRDLDVELGPWQYRVFGSDPI